MKTILILLLSAASLLSAPVVVITDLSTVTVDGKPVGSVVDVLGTNEALRGPVFDALLARDAENIAKAKAIGDFLAKVKEAFNAGDFDAAKAILNPEITKAEQSEKDKKKAELDEQIAKLQAERAELDAIKADAAVKAKARKP